MNPIPPMKKEKFLKLRVSDLDLTRYKALAVRRGVSLSTLIRQAIDKEERVCQP